jgi:phosphoribosylglycinamide formyltransferase-1
MVRIAVLVSGGGTNLQALVDAVKNNEINGEIVFVASNRMKAYGLERAKNANIEAMCIKDESLLIEKLEEHKVDLIVLAGYLAILSGEFISKYEVHQVGDKYHLEYWIPSEELEDFNNHIINKIEVIKCYK